MSTVKANDLTNVTGGIPTVKSQQLIPTAWVNFNGTGTVAIRDSEGVSSITDITTGRYYVNFATNMANTNYISIGCTGGAGGSTGDHSFVPFATGSGNTVSQSPQLRPATHDSTRIDPTYVYYMAMGGQA
jgi:hypothetical protein